MSSQHYGKTVLISRPRYDENIKAWRPYASVTLDDRLGTFRYHQLKPEESFATEEEASSFGFIVARRWVDANLERYAGGTSK
jgi:hypothetical protein